MKYVELLLGFEGPHEAAIWILTLCCMPNAYDLCLVNFFASKSKKVCVTVTKAVVAYCEGSIMMLF